MRIESVNADLIDIIERQKPSCSLEGVFYKDPQVFQLDMEHVIPHQWLLVDHESRIAKPGDYFLFEIGDESIIIIRGHDGKIYAHYNVCCHRGSRICLQKEGRKNLMVCPYHGWSYKTDGTLVKAPYMPEDFCQSEVSLKACHVEVCEGLIFISQAASPPDFAANIEGLDKFLILQGTANCKIAHRHTFETKGNWKLVVENFIECYHCLTAHPEFCSLRPIEMLVSFGAGPSSGDAETAGYSRDMADFEQRASSLGQLPPNVDDMYGEQWFRYAGRICFKDKIITESQDGQPMAPLLHSFKDWDMGYTGIAINPLCHMLSTNDVNILFMFKPRKTETTDVEVIWLVNADAEEDRDYDVDKLTWMWRTTAKQDLTITGNNQAGVNSKAYVPHRHSVMEKNVTAFTQWYMANLKKAEFRQSGA